MTELMRVPSKPFYQWLDKIADNEQTTRESFEKAVTLARKEKFTDLEIALLMKDYLKDKISKSSLWRWTKSLEPKGELEDSTSGSGSLKQNDEKKDTEDNTPPDPPQQPPPEEPKENPLEIENQFLREENANLKDAMHKIQQFTPANQFQEKSSLDTVLNDDTVFQYLRDRAKETGNILVIDRVGSGAIIQAMAQYKKSFGVAEVFLRVIQ